MQQKKQSQKQKQNTYKCPQNRQGLFACSEPSCTKIAVKCLASGSCIECKKNHSKCPREIRISNVIEAAKKREGESAIVKEREVNKEDLLQRLITQLIDIKKEYERIDISSWGLDSNLSSLIFSRQIKNKTGANIYDLLNGNIIYPDAKYYKPPQFRKDVQQVYKINQQLKKRMLILHRVYQKLAECDCGLKKLPPVNRLKDLMVVLRELHEKFRQAIMDRLGLTSVFGGVQQVTTPDEIKNFKVIGVSLFIITFKVIEQLYKQKRYQQTGEFIALALDLFNQNRKQFRLIDTDHAFFKINLQILAEIQAYTLFQLGNYQKSYDYLSKLQQLKLTSQILKKLLILCQKLNLEVQIILKYLLLLERFQANNKDILEKIIDCYRKLNDKQKLYEYYRKINDMLRKDIKKLGSLDIVLFVQRAKFIITLQQQLDNISLMLISLKQVLDDLKLWNGSFVPELIKLELGLRYKEALMHRCYHHSGSRAAQFGIEACEKYLNFIQKDRELTHRKRDQYTKMVKQYHIKFLLLQSQSINHSHGKFPYLSKAISLCQQLNLTFFQPYFQIAKAGFQIKHQEALEFQLKANSIYPTAVCYSNEAYLRYENYFRRKMKDGKELRDGLRAIDRSLMLDPWQVQLVHLRGMINQNLKNFQESNSDFQKVLQVFKTGRKKFDAQRRMAQNNQFILKLRPLTPQKRQQTLTKTLALYQNCIQQDQQHDKCVLGYGRVLKLSKKFPQAEVQFLKLINTELHKYAYMELGNVKEEQAMMSEERDFELLEEAEKMYRKGGDSRENLENLRRIYLELDQPKKSQEIAKKIQML